MKEYKRCKYCDIKFDANLERCPKCHREISHVYTSKYTSYSGEESNGRKHRVGGNACDHCSHCYASNDWCPFMDD